MRALSSHLEPQLGSTASEELQRVLSAVRQGAAEVLADALRGVYLTGSFALGQGDEASDVDFLVVSSRPLAPSEEAGARALHASLPDRPERWAHHLEGSWVDVGALYDPVCAHDPWLYVDNGSRTMERSRHDDTWNARWVLRHAGVPLAGPPASELVPALATADVKAEAVQQADARAEWIHDKPEVLLDGWAQPYVVLTQCRLVWSATYGTVTSKNEAADWIRDSIAPVEYRDLIAASMRYRRQPFDPQAGRADPALAPSAAAFVGWATSEVHARAADAG